jgi:hypothetical protein
MRLGTLLLPLVFLAATASAEPPLSHDEEVLRGEFARAAATYHNNFETLIRTAELYTDMLEHAASKNSAVIEAAHEEMDHAAQAFHSSLREMSAALDVFQKFSSAPAEEKTKFMNENFDPAKNAEEIKRLEAINTRLEKCKPRTAPSPKSGTRITTACSRTPFSFYFISQSSALFPESTIASPKNFRDSTCPATGFAG